jgi:hypothetical protein
MAMLGVVPAEEPLAEGAGVLDAAEPLREGRMVLERLDWLSEYGLSLDTLGREWDLVTPRSVSSSATGLDVIEVPRSAWMVSWCGSTCWAVIISASGRSARLAASRAATIHPTTERLKMSKITYR